MSNARAESRGRESCPVLLLRALLAASTLPLTACFSDTGMYVAGATEAATGTTGPDASTTATAPTTSAGSTGDDTTGEPVDCYSTRDFFADRVWAPLMATNCALCHEPTGIAAEAGAKFRLLTAVYPGFIEANLENIRSIKDYEYQGIPLLLAKPTGAVEHGGGAALDPDGELYDDLVELLVQLEDPVECPVAPPSAAFPDVELLTPEQTLRKAALHLVGRLPSAEERAAVADGGEPALRAALDVFMSEDAFYERLAEIYNDVLFTDAYLTRDGVTTLYAAAPDWPNVLKYFDKVNVMPADQKARIKYAVSREPLSLVQYVVRNNLPFTDILLAPYTVFTPDSAFLYGVDIAFDDPTDPTELKPGVLKVTRNGKQLGFPHAGVLCSPMWLNPFPTTPTNRYRLRARNIYDQFLATDVLALASQAIDPAAGSPFANPTRDASECAKCHRVIDPIAGAFQTFDKDNQELLLDPPTWYPEMFPPGYGNELTPADEFETGLQWLAQRVAADPRFSLATVYTVYTALTGQEPIPYPTDSKSPDFKPLQAAWALQDEALRAIASEFVAADHDFKLIVREVVLSPYYRGINMGRAPTDARKAELFAVGTGRLSTPELLNRKIEAIVGFRWRGVGVDLLLGDYKLLYGGIDSFDVTRRLSEINQIMAAVATRMALEVACTATAFDFTRPAEERLLFPMVDTTDTPDTSEDAIRNNLVYLHDRILGETALPDDPAIDASYKLFADTHAAGVQALLDQTETAGLGPCQALKDPTTSAELPADRQISTDDTYVIRAWQAVVTYLLLDYKFLHE